MLREPQQRRERGRESEMKDEILMAFLLALCMKNAIKIEIYVHLDSSSES